MVPVYTSDKTSGAAAMPAKIGDGVGRMGRVNGQLGPTNPSGSGKLPSLRGRCRECTVLDELLEQVRGGRSTVLVMCGEAGVGKTALLEYLAGRALGCRLARGTGGQSEMELAFAGLHQLCAPMLSGADCVPVAPPEGLRVAVGRGAGPPAGRGPGRAGRAQPAVRGVLGGAAGVRDRRRAVAGPRLGAGPRVRGPAAGRRSGRPGVRRPRSRQRTGWAAGADGGRAG